MQEGNAYDASQPGVHIPYAQTPATANPYDAKIGSVKPTTIVDEYGQSINDLAEKLDVLEARLATICRPDYPQETDSVPLSEVSEARTQLQRLQHQSHRIGVILDRLEV